MTLTRHPLRTLIVHTEQCWTVPVGNLRGSQVLAHRPGRRGPALARIALSILRWDYLDRDAGTLAGLWLPGELELD